MNAIVTHFGAHAEFTGVTNQDRAGWLALRKTMLTASDVAAVLGEDEHRSALDCYVDKVTERRGPEEIGIDDPRFWGSILEQPILTAVARYYGWEYHAGGALLRSRKHPQLGATLDAEINRGAGWEVLEGKTTRVPRGWDEDSGELPTRILIQCQVQLLVTGAPADVVFALLQGSKPVRVEVYPSPEFHAVIVEEAERFMDRVARMDPPPPDHTEASKRALLRLYPQDDGGGVILPDCAIDWTREIKAITAEENRLKARKEELKNMLRAAIGPATYGLLRQKDEDGQAAWKNALEHKPSYVVAAQETRALRAIKKVPPVRLATSADAPALPDSSIADLIRAPSPTADPAELELAAVGGARTNARRRRARR